ncbi:hypothetical protein [Maribacter litoralis]|uniref:hypothetical protein n=1 Tax=Maribacter litoralis TaxID=2059726 RepID=UPI003F5CD2FF
MEKVTVKDLVDFKRKSDRAKKTFAQKIKTREVKPKGDGGGGNWWSTSLSAIGNTFKTGDKDEISKKIEDLNDRYNSTDVKLTKMQYTQNIEVLQSMLDYDFEQIRPEQEFSSVKSIYEQKMIEISGFPVQAWPTSVFSFKENDEIYIGSVWFVTNKYPFKDSELGMYAEMLYRFLSKWYSTKFKVNPSYCIAVEPKRGAQVNYKMIEDGKVISILDKTLLEIKNM